MLRKLICATSALAVALCATAGMAHAATTALSINFTDGSSSVGANTAGVDAYGNWNDMTAVGTFAAAGSMNLSDGSTATGVKVDNFAGFGYVASAAPTAGSTGDQAMMAGGNRSIWDNNGSYVYSKTAIQLSGLSNLGFDSYTVRVYNSWDAGSPYASTSKSAAFVASSNAADFGLSSGLGSNFAYYNTVDAVGSAMGANNGISNYGYGGDFNANQFFLESGPIDGTTDLLVITDFSNSGTTNQFSGLNWNAVQIIGEVGAVPEPSSIALAGIGLVGLVGMGLRRRKK